MKYVSFLFLLTLSLAPWSISVAQAEELTYAVSLVSATANVLTASQAVGAPDHLYADFRDGETSIVLNMGETSTATGDMTLYFRVFNTGASARLTLMDADNQTIVSQGGILSLTEDTLVVSNSSTTVVRYVKIESTEEEEWSVDAISFESASPSTSENASEAEPPTVEDTAGMLVKLADANTIYVLGSDGKRHAFPNQVVFDSWYDSSAVAVDITTIDAVTMASFKLGTNVTMRPSTWLIKITTDPKVYAVEPGGVLRWVTSEVIAEALYGSNWNTKVADVADTFWPNYTIGDDLDSVIYPDGSIVLLIGGFGIDDVPNAGYWYIKNGTRYSVSDTMRTELTISYLFLWDVAEDTLDLYVDGGEFELTNSVQFPY